MVGGPRNDRCISRCARGCPGRQTNSGPDDSSIAARRSFVNDKGVVNELHGTFIHSIEWESAHHGGSGCSSHNFVRCDKGTGILVHVADQRASYPAHCCKNGSVAGDGRTSIFATVGVFPT